MRNDGMREKMYAEKNVDTLGLKILGIVVQ